MIYKERPKNFNPKFDVISCFVEYDGEILLLHRQDHKPEGNTWGVPAGKVDKGESLLEAMTREIQEEIKYVCDNVDKQRFKNLNFDETPMIKWW